MDDGRGLRCQMDDGRWMMDDVFDVIPRRQVSYIGALTPSPTPHSQHKYYYAAYRLNHLFNCFYVGIILVCSKIFKHVLKPCVPSQLLLHTDAYFYVSGMSDYQFDRSFQNPLY